MLYITMNFLGTCAGLLSFALVTASAAEPVPRSLDELWADFAALDKGTPLQVETLKEWRQEGVICRILRYQVGVFKGAPARVAAFYAYPQEGTKFPALLSLHGGGQSASLDNVVSDARHGYAGLSLNWGGNKLNFGRAKMSYDGPQTDWGRLDATHPPQRNKVNHFAGPLTPDDYTLDSVESPRNSNWFLVLMAARRAITLLQQQPEVDAGRIGVYGHSMGGKLTTDLAGIDPRVKAAVPSCGGAGDILQSQTDLPGCVKSAPAPMELACVSDNAYIPRITCPVLWLSPTNDFNAPVSNMAWNWRSRPDAQVRFSISPHLNHRHTDEHAIAQHLWFEQHLKGAFTMPRTPRLELTLKSTGHVPAIRVTPDDSQSVRRVDIYYSIDPHELSRFWRHAVAKKAGNRWMADCPVMSLEQPLFAYADVVYDTPVASRNLAWPPGQENTDTFAISSRMLSETAAQLKASGVKATDGAERMIDDGSRGWEDWYRLNWVHAPLWVVSTRKLKDPKWRGPDGARLVFEMRPETDNTQVIKVNTNAWGAFVPGQPSVDYACVKQIKGGDDWQTVSVGLADLLATDPGFRAPLSDWHSITELSFSPSGDVVANGRKIKIVGQPWQGPRAIRNLRWEGGEYSKTTVADRILTPAEHQRAFDEAIKKSLEQEKQDLKPR